MNRFFSADVALYGNLGIMVTNAVATTIAVAGVDSVRHQLF